MKVLVAYASRHGATRGIAERIAQQLQQRGVETTLQPCGQAKDVGQYDAFVVGSAAYAYHWLKDATTFARRNKAVLGSHPTWLFSSGPLGNEKVDAQGRDPLETSKPREFAEFASDIRPRDAAVFFGAWDPNAKAIGIMERLMNVMPAARNALPAGDFRDWPQIDAWADGIARELQSAPAAST